MKVCYWKRTDTCPCIAEEFCMLYLGAKQKGGVAMEGLVSSEVEVKGSEPMDLREMKDRVWKARSPFIIALNELIFDKGITNTDELVTLLAEKFPNMTKKRIRERVNFHFYMLRKKGCFINRSKSSD